MLYQGRLRLFLLFSARLAASLRFVDVREQPRGAEEKKNETGVYLADGQ
jgi:hypothetical protein